MKRRTRDRFAAVLCTLAWTAAPLAAQSAIPLSSPGEPFTLEVHVAWGAIDLRRSESELTWRAEDDEGRPAEVLAEERDNRVVLRQPPPDTFSSANLFVSVPPGGRVSIVVERGGDVFARGLAADLEITNYNGSVDVLDHRGSAVVNATNGTIRADMVEPNERPLLFSTLNGSAHVCLGGEPRREVLLSTRDDDILSDFTIERRPPDRSLHAGEVLEGGAPLLHGTIGEGGPLLRVATANGDILLRRCR
ncbi:MAG: hypothetical protein AAGA81_07650 [Acidobacteriota bacterium]